MGTQTPTAASWEWKEHFADWGAQAPLSRRLLPGSAVGEDPRLGWCQIAGFLGVIVDSPLLEAGAVAGITRRCVAQHPAFVLAEVVAEPRIFRDFDCRQAGFSPGIRPEALQAGVERDRTIPGRRPAGDAFKHVGAGSSLMQLSRTQSKVRQPAYVRAVQTSRATRRIFPPRIFWMSSSR